MDTKSNLIIIVAYLHILVNCKLELEITKGIIKGKILKSRDGRPYYSYTGIPYAKPPLENLRFKAPESVEPWDGILDATKTPNMCIQKGNSDSSEDCLYLNVYSPKTDSKSLPVLFYIHGGAFASGNSISNGPDYFMDKDVILVTINYRLGILGFISTEDDVIPGNYGMKDQVFALRWVQENIVKFNGNPNEVTIFGGSAGGASTGFHMLSPMSKGLFHKAILQSGSPICKWATTPTGLHRKRAHTLSTIAGCYADTSEDILNCLRKLPAQYLMVLHNQLHSWTIYPTILFNPVVENCDSGQEAFLCHNPVYDFKQESFVPAMVGVNSAEGGLYFVPMCNTTYLEEFRTYFNRLFSIISNYNYDTNPEHIDEIGNTVLKKYFPSGEIDDDLVTIKMFGDSNIYECVFSMAYQLSSPVYSYLYDYQNTFSFNTLFGDCKKPLGVAHGDELTSIFKMIHNNPTDLNEKDLEVSKLMVNIWFKFASSEHPTIDGSENGLAWPIFTQTNQNMLHVNSSSPGVIQNPYIDSYEFWNKLRNYYKQNH